MPDSNLSKLSYIIRCIRVWNVVADDELNLRMNARNDFNQAMVEQYKTALSNHDCENPCTFNLSLSVLNVISVVVLPSLSLVAFDFVVKYFDYSYIFNFLAPSNWLTLLRNPCHFFSVTLFDYLNVFI